MCDMLYMNALFDIGIETIFGVTCELISWFVDVFIYVIEYEWMFICDVDNETIREWGGCEWGTFIGGASANDYIRKWGQT